MYINKIRENKHKEMVDLSHLTKEFSNKLTSALDSINRINQNTVNLLNPSLQADKNLTADSQKINESMETLSASIKRMNNHIMDLSKVALDVSKDVASNLNNTDKKLVAENFATESSSTSEDQKAKSNLSKIGTKEYHFLQN